MAMQSNKYMQCVRLSFLPGDIRASKIPQANTTTTSPVDQQTDSLAGNNHETEPSSHLALGVYERALELHPRVL